MNGQTPVPSGKREGLLALGAYILISVAYFSRALFDGRLLAPGDGISQYFPFMKLNVILSSNGFPPLWDPFSLSGFPFFARMQPGVLYPPNWLAFVLPHPMAFNLLMVGHYAFAAWAAFLFFRAIGAGRFAAFCAGTVFGFTGYLASNLHHTGNLFTTSWLPLVLYFIERLRSTMKSRYAAYAALAITAQVFAGHPQIVLLTLIISSLYVLFFTFTLKGADRLKYPLKSFASMTLAGIIALPQLLATFELSRLSERADASYKFFTSFSFPPHLLPSMVFPYFMGHGYGGKYWGPLLDQTMPTGYIGVLALAIAITTFVIGARSKNTQAIFWGLVAIATMLLSMGRYLPLYELLYKLPVYKMFRVPSMHLVETDFALLALFSIGLTGLLDAGGRGGYRRWPLILVTIVGSFAALSATVFREDVLAFINQSIHPMRPALAVEALSLGSPALYFPLILIAVSAGWLIAIGFSRGRGIIKFLLIAILLAESYLFMPFDQASLPETSEVSQLCDTGAIGFIKAEGGGRTAFIHDRMQPLQGAMCGLRMVDGYDPLAITRYNSILGVDTGGAYPKWMHTLISNDILDMLNTEYIVVAPHMENFISGVTAGIRRIDFENVMLSPIAGSSAESDGSVSLTADNSTVTASASSDKHRQAGLYMITLEARGKTDSPLSIEIGSSPPRIFNIPPEGLGDRFRPLSLVVDIGESEYIAARTQSRHPAYMKNLTISLVRPEPPYLPDSTSGASGRMTIYEKIYSDTTSAVYRNRGVMPQVYTVESLKAAGNNGPDRNYFDSNQFDPSVDALVSDEDLKALGQADFKTGKLMLRTYRPGEAVIDKNYEGHAFVILSEEYYPGWKAYVDGENAKVIRTNGVLMGVAAPEGSKEITFVYRPFHIYAAFALSGIVLMAMLLTMIFRRKVD